MIMARELVFTSEKKTVYRDGSTAIKEFCDGFPKAEVLNEALCNARVEDIEAMKIRTSWKNTWKAWWISTF